MQPGRAGTASSDMVVCIVTPASRAPPRPLPHVLKNSVLVTRYTWSPAHTGVAECRETLWTVYVTWRCYVTRVLRVGQASVLLEGGN